MIKWEDYKKYDRKCSELSFKGGSLILSNDYYSDGRYCLTSEFLGLHINLQTKDFDNAKQKATEWINEYLKEQIEIYEAIKQLIDNIEN